MDTPDVDLGQHLLKDPQAIKRVLEAAKLQPGERVLDAGAGTGALTRPIAAAVGPTGTVLAVDVDPGMIDVLRRASLPPQVRIEEGDLLQVDLPEGLDAVVANPPFRIVAPFIERMLAARVPRAILVVPQELAERLVARPGSERYGKLTVRVGVAAAVANLGLVSRHAFRPPPGVDCSIIRVRLRSDAPPVDATVLRHVLDVAWEGWDRKAKRALSTLPTAYRADSAAFMELLKLSGWAEQPVGTLPPFAFATLSRHLKERGRASPPPGATSGRAGP